MKYFIIFTFILHSIIYSAQNPIGFDKMCNDYISKTVPLVTPQQLNKVLNLKNTIILDARETKEYKVSHIKGAKQIGYNNFKIESVRGVDKNSNIYIYCSIGYRSEKIGEKLKKAGFNNVYNLYGGIFNWANLGYELFDTNQKKTTIVHGYNNEWSQWLNNQKCTKIIN